MSNYGLSGASGAGDAESNANFESILAQLRRQSSPSPDPNSGPGPDQFAQFGYNQGAGQSFYNHLSNSNSPNLSGSHGPIDSPAFLPEAPTPPVGFSNAQFPPGLMNPIGAGRNLGGVGGDDRTANLLNLLKYSSSGGQGGGHHHQQQQLQQQSQQQQQQPHHQQQQNLHHLHQSQPQQTQQPPATREPPMNFAPAPIAPPVIHAPAPAAADPTGLLAALMKGRLEADSTKPEQQSSSSTWNQSSPPSSGTQQYLLNLLNKPKPSQHDTDLVEPSLLTPPPAEDESSHGGRSAEPTLVGTLASRSEFEFEHKNLDTPHSHHSQQSQVTSQPGGHGSYSNPFDDVSGSSPAHRTPKSSTPGASSAAGGNSQPPAHGVIQILKKPDSGQSSRDQKRPLSDRGSVNSPESARRKLEHAPSPLSHTSAAARPPPGIYSPASDTSAALSHTAARKSDVPIADAKESVSEAVTGLAEQADREAREALARAQREQAQAEIAQDLDKMLGARTEEEFAQSAQGASQAIMKELDKDKNQNVLQSTLTPELAKEVTDILEEASQAAQGPVADSWESAEADEIVVIEETAAPVKVYNFPMKPWITISLQETNETRPVFRDETILDIARLKKDFDQIDRNLVSASETYMAYGMSKAGGLRVIRQEDGKDAKLFTDTKDRIFNVAISTSPSSEHPKETIIGTGVSGTVYWVQLKSGDRDHLEDAHPEQYGFALPPVAAPEGGDTPGGVLKTRARASSMHPDYFAVGRGKSINIIWPSFIFENNLFKNAHDRVVDTEKLLKQCSLKINTGKAGKDFTFSQDDTLVVSLDKSGRVKFWDVRDLTAVKEGSDPLNPMPAQTSLEIKEPLMTLTTTPEGEKAWPTSVLLLDKFRPYQRRTALRYMIVGMKQNHTLQLWDLALGKPVQEFNFPHNKESDAVCSVMYHAPSSMIVVGHPTRNSIYFLHLSAPKYSLKNLSQVDYIQRLVAQDQSIPQPESTAVISGIREYSFASKGVLRSLNMLENPAASGDGDQPTLFELYAMHSKGVTCLFVKQAELGWTKDNKVILPADAVESGLAKVSKLVAPPPAQPVEPQQQPNGSNDAAAIPQIRIASRGAKDILQKTPSSQGEDKREAASPPKLDRKDENETPVPQPERAEKKGRKKKNAAAAAAAAGSTDRDFLASNGSAEISRAPPQNKAGKTARSNADSSAANSTDLSLAPNGFSTEQLELVVNKMEARIVASVSGRFDAVFNQIFQQMQDLQKKRDADFAFSQSHLLQMVSNVLNDNTESVLKNLIIEQIENSVVPSVSRSVERTVIEHLGAQGNAQINGVQKEIQRLLPNVVAQALQKADMVKTISDRVSHNVNPQLEIQVNKAFSALAPGLAKTTAQTVHQRIVEDVNGQINNAFERLEERRRDEDAKLDRLIAQTKDLSNAISSLAASQTQIIKDLAILKEQAQEPSRGKAPVPQVPVHLGSHARNSADSYSQPPPDYTSQQQFPHQHQPPAAHSHAHQHTSQRQHQHQLQHQHQPQFNNPEHQVVFTPTSHEDREKIELDALLKAVDQLMQSGHFDDAMMRWLQSNKTEEVFQQVISRYETTNWLPELAPLLLLSVGATIANDFHPNTPKLLNKIDILELLVVVFQQKVPSLDDQTRDVTPRIMGLLKARSEELLVAISHIDPHHSALKQLSAVSQGARHIMESVPAHHGSGHHNAPY